MSASTLSPVLQRLVRGRFPGAPERLTPELRFEEDLQGDSLSFVELVTDLEAELKVRLPDDAAAAARTVGQLAALVRDLQERAASAPTPAARSSDAPPASG